MDEENPYKSPGELKGPEDVVSADGTTADDPLDRSLVKLTSFMSVSEAQLVQAVLRQEGIESYLENEGSIGVNWLWSNAIGGVKLLVAHDELEAAAEILESVDTSASEAVSTEDITFECEECGKEITFPGSRRGKTETCPKCHEYVDVPE